ncbi:MAG: trypsin-like serine protease [Planctomycetota bacterium]
MKPAQRILATAGFLSLVAPVFAVDSPIDRSIAWSDGVFNAVAQPLIVTSGAPPVGGAPATGDDRLADPGDLSTSGGVDLSGVGRLFLDVSPTPGAGAICSSSLMQGGRFLLTAAHCVTDENGDEAVIDGADGNSVTFETSTGNVFASFDAEDISVHPLYNGDVRDGFDVAVIDLGQTQPTSVARYALNDSSPEGGLHLAAGFGQSGDGGAGATVGAGSLRSGFNNFLVAGLPVGNINNPETQLTADFDSGLAENDAFGVLGDALFGAAIDDPINGGLGLGVDEIGVAPGDSGGPTFIETADGLVIAGVHSYGLRLELIGGATSDLDAALNSSFGEFYVDARVADPAVLAFIESAAIPEPTAIVLLLSGVALPRRRSWRDAPIEA